MQIKELKIGTKLEVSLTNRAGDNASPYYPVKLQCINDDFSLEVDVPIYNTKVVFFNSGSSVQVTTTLQDGIYSFQANVVGFKKKGQIPVMALKPESEMQKIQRRSYFRLNYICTAKYRPFKLTIFGSNEETFKSTHTVNLSGGGMCILSDEKIEKTNFLECVIILEKEISIRVIGKVVSVEKDDINELKKWKLGIQFERILEVEREKIINFIFQEQLKLRRKELV